jgi:hypothetical protein
VNRPVYAVLPDVASARRAADELAVAGIAPGRLRFLGARGASLAGLQEAGVLQKSDLLHALALGTYFGLLVGSALGLHLWFNPIGEHVFGPGALAAACAGGAAFGAWAASLVGVSTPNERLRRFEADFAAGRILLIAHVPPARAPMVRELLARQHHATVPALC